MGARLILVDQNKAETIVQEGESFNLLASFKDVSATPAVLAKADIVTLTLTLSAGTTIINSRDEIDIRDANGGSLTDAGALTLKLDSADQAIVDTSLDPGDLEEHVALIKWTWSDGTTRTGKKEIVFNVQKVAV